MFKILLKHKIAEIAIDNLFNNLNNNLISSKLNELEQLLYIGAYINVIEIVDYNFRLTFLKSTISNIRKRDNKLLTIKLSDTTAIITENLITGRVTRKYYDDKTPTIFLNMKHVRYIETQGKCLKLY